MFSARKHLSWTRTTIGLFHITHSINLSPRWRKRFTLKISASFHKNVNYTTTKAHTTVSKSSSAKRKNTKCIYEYQTALYNLVHIRIWYNPIWNNVSSCPACLDINISVKGMHLTPSVNHQRVLGEGGWSHKYTLSDFNRIVTIK